ncbi:MAG: hypothetical protein L6R39_003227 [Caloplaca ligustica]|nr:MAG: hypothetical protein L6R39_003227 [Caloplaca ligustica]
MTAANDDTGPLYVQRIAEELHSRSRNTNASTNLISAVLILVLTYQIVYWLDYPLLPMSELLWNSAVYATPSRVITALESVLRPSTAEEARSDADQSKSVTHAQKSETMRRVLGLDGTGMLGKFQKAKSLPAVNTLFQSRSKGSPPGLGNWDNSCYQNSVIQGLASLPSFSAFLRQSGPANPSKSTTAALEGIIEKLKEPSSLGAMFWTPAQLKSMSSWQQQDAQEYFSKLMDEVDKENALDGKRAIGHAGLAAIRDLSPDLAKAPIAEIEETAEEQAPIRRQPPALSQLPDEIQSIAARNPLEGLLAQRVGCLRCGYVEGLSLIPFNCLTLPLGKHSLYDIRGCLDEYTALEPINGVDCAKCTLLQSKTQLEKLRNQFSEEPARELQASAPLVSEALKASVEERLAAVNEALHAKDFSDNTIHKKCQIPQKSKVSSTKTRQAVIARAPKSLAIHINRSVFDEMTGMLSKNHADVRFPLRFSLASWCLGGRTRAGEGEDGTEHWNTNPSESMLPSDVDDEERPGSNVYELRAALTHYGRHENGHYICYRRHEAGPPIEGEPSKSKDAAWWRFSDEDVSAVSEENVLAQGGVFMLLYERTDEPSPSSDVPPIEAAPAISNDKKVSPPNDADLADTELHSHKTASPATDEVQCEDNNKAYSDVPSTPENPLPEVHTDQPSKEPIHEPPPPNPILSPEPPSQHESTDLPAYSAPQTAHSYTTNPNASFIPPPPTATTSPPSDDEPSSSVENTEHPSSPPPPAPPEAPPKRESGGRSFSHSMRTATPRSGMGSVSSSSMVTAN